MDRVADKLFDDVTINIETPGLDTIREKVQELMEELKPKLEEIMKEWVYSEVVNLQNLSDPGEPKDFYDVVLKEIGANMEDAEEVREALKWRLS